MFKRYLQPYTFRGSLMIALYISAAFAAVISLLFAYVISHVNVQSELQLQQNALAVYLLEIDNRTDLSLPIMLGMIDDVEDTHVEAVTADMPDLPEDFFSIIKERKIISVLDDVAKTPVTYVQLEEGVVKICIGLDSSLNSRKNSFFGSVSSVSPRRTVRLS